MKQKHTMILLILWVLPTAAKQVDYMLCHADPLYSEYNYGGVWELDEDGEPICNFWKFLPEGQNERPTSIVGAEESEESDFYIVPENNDTDEIIEYYDDTDLSGDQN